MGCNFYTLKGHHIGKRWAAGFWCWDCKAEVLVIMKDGSKLTQTEWGNLIGAKGWDGQSTSIRECPICHKTRDISLNKPKFNPAMRELGFDKSEPVKLTGIDGASGFGWCTDAGTGLARSKENILKKLKRLRFVEDEYGKRWSVKEFLKSFDQVATEDESPYEFS